MSWFQCDCSITHTTIATNTTIAITTLLSIQTFSESVFEQDPETNPDFYGANLVYVPYCTGDVHSGTRSSTTPAWPDDEMGYFSGHKNFEVGLVGVTAHALE